MPAAGRFTGWPPEAMDWLAGIEANNSRDWFHANRATYDAAVRGPLEALLDDATDEFGEGKAFRPNRDTRFAADKSPYKTNVAAVIPRPAGGAFYLSLSSSGLYVGAGYYMMGKDQLERFRAAVADDRTGPAVEQVVADLRARGLELGGEALTSAPRGYPKDHPRIELLRRKGLVAGREHPPRAWLHTRAAEGRVFDVWRAVAPMHGWLDDHVGPSRE
jgi:uncharacterized protein (TIGR02453 family)